MPIAEKVTETVSEWKDDLRESVERLKDEVAEMKTRLRGLIPGRRRGSEVPVRFESRRAVPGSWDDPGNPLDAWFGRFPAWSGLFDFDWPRIDIREKDTELLVKAELPGVEDDDLDVSVDGDVLTIRGERKTEHEDRGKDYLRHECFYGSFHRTIPIPFEIEPDHVEATFRRGVLTVRLPRSRAARERVKRIAVRRD